MEKNTEYLLGGILIIVFCFAMFNLNILDITGFTSKTTGITIETTDKFGNAKTTFERGEILYATINVEKGKSIDNRYLWLVRGNVYRNQIGATNKLICGVGTNTCDEGTYVVKYGKIEDTIDKFADGNYFIRIKEHKKDYIYEPFTIKGPKLGHYVDGSYYG